MTRARDTSRVQIGINTAVSGNDEFTYVETAAKHLTSDLTLDTSNAGASASIVTLERTHLVVDSGVSLNVGSDKHLMINPYGLPHTVS
jgi:hypothetical protein